MPTGIANRYKCPECGLRWIIEPSIHDPEFLEEQKKINKAMSDRVDRLLSSKQFCAEYFQKQINWDKARDLLSYPEGDTSYPVLHENSNVNYRQALWMIRTEISRAIKALKEASE